jgi:hypothetical protein
MQNLQTQLLWGVGGGGIEARIFIIMDEGTLKTPILNVVFTGQFVLVGEAIW